MFRQLSVRPLSARTFFAIFLLFALLAPAALASPADGSCPGLCDEDEVLPIDPDPLYPSATTTTEKSFDPSASQSSDPGMSDEDEVLPIDPDPLRSAPVDELIVSADFPVRLSR